MDAMNCLRCGSPMRFIKSEQLQFGRADALTGVWSNIFSGALAVEIYQCEACGKLEFFSREELEPSESLSDGLPQRTCPQCGLEHDFDYPKCPNCGYDYYRNG